MSALRIPVGEETFDARVAGPDDGEVVLLLHGFPQTSWSWRHQLAALGEAGYRAVAPDQRGYSAGARPSEVERYAIPSLVADVVAIADEIGATRFHLVGHDWGAAVAWQVAGHHQHRLKSLTILSVPHPKAFGRAITGEDGSDQATRSSYVDFFRSDEAADAFLQNGGEGLRNMFGMTGLTDDIDPYVEVLTQPGAMQGALNWYRAASLTDADTLGEITMPTLFVWSTDDPALGPDAAKWTAEYVSGPYRFEVFEGVGHWIAESEPDRLNALLLEHLSSA